MLQMQNAMNFEQLRVFVAVAERLHVTQAAKALNMTQSSASAAIAALEHRYRVKLFHRVGRRIELTEAGRLFLVPAQELLAHVAEAESIFNELAGLERGTINLHTSHTIANYWLPNVVSGFHSSFPTIKINIAIANTQRVISAVLHGEADLGFIEGPMDEPAIARLRIGQDNLWLIVGNDHPWRNREIATLPEVMDLDWVMRDQGSGSRATFFDILAKSGLDPNALKIVLELPSNGAVRAAVEGGAGAGILPDSNVKRSVETGSLVHVAIEMPARPYHVIWHKERVKSKAVAVLLEYLTSKSTPAKKA